MRILQDCTTASTQVLALGVQNARELNNQNGVGDDDAGHHDDAHQRHDVERRAGEQQDQHHACKAGWNGHQNNERIEEGCELRHQHEIDERDGEDKADAEAREGVRHALDRAANRDAHAARPLHVLNDMLHLPADGVQRRRTWLHIDIDHAPQRVVIHLGGRVDRFREDH